ncbi:ATP synthase subunit A [Methylomarinum vadi]|uniref:ATP synthase subunit A n=1 Tax=Methylomarinum vadi TaxID=438855 RepID=UPI0004DF956F|nr:ATP synthase subunit A [Methylomarinum vadi]
MTNKAQTVASSGVEALIDRLRNEGVSAGQKKAENIVLDAQKRAEWLIQEAEEEARQLTEKARQEADAILATGKDALQLAARDALIKLRDTLLNSFSQEVTRVVGQRMQDPAFIDKLILSLAGTVREKTGMDNSQSVVIQLPEDVMGVDELKKNPEELQQGTLSHYTASLAADMLREGVRFEVSGDLSGGLFIRLENEEMQIDFSDKTVAALLLEHIQPRFRALLQGIVK